MSDSASAPDLKHDERLARDLLSAAAVLQQRIHSAVEAGLMVSLTVETMHQVGHRFPEPLVEVSIERVIKLP